MGSERIALLGANGMLGTEVAVKLKEKNINFNSYDLPDFDITSNSQIENAINNSGLIINCAAYTDVEKAEREKNLAYKINAEAVGQLGNLAKKKGVYVLHISTDFVFDGTLDRPYVETDSTNPINVYGASKLAGENLLLESSCNNCILRIEWTYGRNGNNFIKKMISYSQKSRQIKVVDDQAGSPTATTEVADIIIELIQKKPQGIFHFANSGYVTRFETAKFIFQKLNVPVELIKCKSEDFPSAAKRPLNSRFNCGKISSLLNKKINNWQVPLEKFLKEI